MVENLELRDGEEIVLDVRCGCIKPKEDFATKANDGFLHEVGAFVTNRRLFWQAVFAPPMFSGDVPERLQKAIESLRSGEAVSPSQQVPHVASGAFTRRGLPMKWLWVAIGVAAFIVFQLLKK